MASLTTQRTINPSQLSAELGRVALRCVGPREDGSWSVEADSIDATSLQAAVDAHVADPNWIDPSPPPPTPEQQRDDVMQALRARSFQVFQDPQNNTFTPVQMQRILAALVLKATR